MKTPAVGLTPAQRRVIKPALAKVNEARKELAKVAKVAGVRPPDDDTPSANPCTSCDCPDLIRMPGTNPVKCKRCGHGAHWHLR